MKLTILQNKLKEALGIVERIAAKSPTLPILNNILLKAENNFLELSATDLELGIKFWILSKIEKEGSIAVPAQIFSSYVSSLTQAQINLEVKKGTLHLSSKEAETKIKGSDAQDFPIIPVIKENDVVSVQSRFLCEGLSKMINICSPSTIRPEISGVFLNVQKESLKMAAADSFRLGEKKITFKKPLSISQEYSLILPQKAASYLVSVFSQDDLFDVYFSPNLLMIESSMQETEHPRVQFISKLIEGEYPKYEEIIPKEYKTEAVLSRNEFLKQLKTAGIFAGRINEVKITFDAKSQDIKIFCQNPELGEHKSSLSAKIKGENAEISFNYKFLLDGLESIDGSEVLFALSKDRNGEEGPAVVKPVEDETYLYVVMPIQAT